MKRILIYDDEPSFRGKVRELIESVAVVKDAFEIETPGGQELKDSMETLQSRRRSFRKTGAWNDERIDLDDAGILVVDYDLFEAVGFLNADAVAYMARCFSSCGLIVGYRYGDNTFDLTLRGHPRSFTDLYAGGTQLGNPGLWKVTEVNDAGFRPWYWPVLLDYLLGFEKEVEDVKESLAQDTPIWKVLGFQPDLFTMLPRPIAQFLGDKPAEMTFRRFVTQSENGLEQRDRESADRANYDVLARVGAARISKWLEWLVLPEQDILVDAPHLVSRYPSLLVGNTEDIDVWNRTSQLTSYDEIGMLTDPIEPFRLKKDHWLSRPIWFWDELRDCESIVEVREPWKFDRPDWVFCEDMSRFYSGEDLREFVADVESPYARRFVRGFDNVEYRPAVRFSL